MCFMLSDHIAAGSMPFGIKQINPAYSTEKLIQIGVSVIDVKC